MIKLFKLLLKEIRPYGRLRFLKDTLLIQVITLGLIAIAKKHPVMQLILTLAAQGFMFYITYARILDIELGLNRRTILMKLWLILAAVLVSANSYAIFFYLDKDMLRLLYIPFVLSIVFYIYLAVKPGHKDTPIGFEEDEEE